MPFWRSAYHTKCALFRWHPALLKTWAEHWWLHPKCWHAIQKNAILTLYAVIKQNFTIAAKCMLVLGQCFAYIHCNNELKAKFYNSSPLSFFRQLVLPSSSFPNAHVQRIVAMFGITYCCEQLFSKKKNTKSQHTWYNFYVLLCKNNEALNISDQYKSGFLTSLSGGCLCVCVHVLA